MGSETEARQIILQVRPNGHAPSWWPKEDDQPAWVTLDPENFGCWTLGRQPEYVIDASELDDESGTSLVDALINDWEEDHEDDEYDELAIVYEFQTVEVFLDGDDS